MHKPVLVLVATIAMLSLFASAASAQRLSAAGKCEAAKNQEAGKYAACLHKAEARLIKLKGTCSLTSATACIAASDCPPLESCVKDTGPESRYGKAVTKCQTKFDSKWGKLEAAAAKKGDVCPDGLPAAEIRSAVDAHVARTGHALSGNARFVDNGDGTITDNDTGLMWEKKVKLDSTTDLANLQDADNFYCWSGTCSVTTSKRCQPDAAASAACFAGGRGRHDRLRRMHGRGRGV